MIRYKEMNDKLGIKTKRWYIYECNKKSNTDRRFIQLRVLFVLWLYLSGRTIIEGKISFVLRASS